MLFLANISWKGASRFSGGEVGGSGVFQMGGFVGGVPKGGQGGGIGFVCVSIKYWLISFRFITMLFLSLKSQLECHGRSNCLSKQLKQRTLE